MSTWQAELCPKCGSDNLDYYAAEPYWDEPYGFNYICYHCLTWWKPNASHLYSPVFPKDYVEGKGDALLQRAYDMGGDDKGILIGQEEEAKEKLGKFLDPDKDYGWVSLRVKGSREAIDSVKNSVESAANRLVEEATSSIYSDTLRKLDEGKIDIKEAALKTRVSIEELQEALNEG